jgi:hypothetical protein
VELTGVVWCGMWGPSRLRPTTSTCNPKGGGGSYKASSPCGCGST